MTEDAIRTIEETIRQLEKACKSGALTPEIANLLIRREKEKLAALTALLEEEAAENARSNTRIGGAAVSGDISTGGGDFIGRDRITQYIYQGTYGGSAPRTDVEREQIYRAVLADMCGRLPLRGMGDPNAESPTGRQGMLGLAGVYIQLDTDTAVPKTRLQQALRERPADPWRVLRSPEEGERRAGVRMKGQTEAVPLSALDAVILFRRTVLLGNPGSGKTTFLNHLAYTLAKKDWSALPDWPDSERDALPILVVLRDFAYWLQSPENRTHRNARRLWAFIANDLENRNLSFVLPLLEGALQSGKAVVLLDGLDEVPPDADSRASVLQAVQDFSTRYRQSRFVVTCRVLSYQETAWQLPKRDYPAFTLQPFDDRKIEQFIRAWHTEVAVRWNKPRKTVENLERKLRAEVFRRPDLYRLAPNPLLLTVMALVHTMDGALPETRAILYSRAVDILLWQWDQEKHKEQSDAAPLLTLLQQAQRNKSDVRVVLAELAYRAHRQIGGLDAGHQDEPVGIPAMDLLKTLRKLHPENSLDWAEQVVDVLRLRSGLLVERTGGVFAFPHRTFQEYLAGVHLAIQPDFVKQACRRAREGNYWRIVILLGTGYQVHERLEFEKPRLLIEELCPEDAPDDAESWRMAWLAGEVILEMGVNRLVQDNRHGKRLLGRVRRRLAELVENGHLAPAERLEAGDVLGKLGDPRFGAIAWNGAKAQSKGDEKRLHITLPARFRGQPEPALGFVRIPAGAFWMGSGEDDSDAYDDEKPRHKLYLPEFWLARYPVTNQQYADFIAAGGYDTERYWTPEGWAWRNGAAPDFSAIETYPDKDTVRQYKEWVLGRADRTRPHWWQDPQWGAATRPVVGVTWYEALAYCAWLNEALAEQDEGLRLPGGEESKRFQEALASGRYRATLPSEAEWEKAARGGVPPSPLRGGAGGRGRVSTYPWGDEITPEHANYEATGLRQTAPVGMFPKGASPCGALGLSGNVWEWTRSKWGMEVSNPEYGYPYAPADGRETLDGPDLRVVRGGSWYLDRRGVRAAVRLRFFPFSFPNYIGFRVVLSPAKLGGGAAAE